MRGRSRLVTMVRGPDVDATVTVRFGPDLEFITDLGPSGHIFFLRYIGPALAPLLDAVLRPGDTFVDVGANVGIYSCWAARRVGAAGRVVAFEPVRVTRERLERNVEHNGLANVVAVHPDAVGAEEGTVTIWFDERALGLASSAYTPDATSCEVRVVALSSVLGEQPVRLVKIDVEGSEVSVLRGMRPLLRGDDPPIVVVEVLSDHLHRMGSRPADVMEILTAAGYGVFSLTHRGIQPAGRGWDSANLLALHPGWHAAEADALRRLRFARDQNQ